MSTEQEWWRLVQYVVYAVDYVSPLMTLCCLFSSCSSSSSVSSALHLALPATSYRTGWFSSRQSQSCSRVAAYRSKLRLIYQALVNISSLDQCNVCVWLFLQQEVVAVDISTLSIISDRQLMLTLKATTIPANRQEVEQIQNDVVCFLLAAVL